MRFTIYPWDLKSWRSAFRVTGLPGIALFCLLIGAMFQIADTSGGGGAGHSSAGAIVLIRTPAIVIAFLMLLFRPRIATLRGFDLRFAYAMFALMYLASALWSEQRVQTIGKAAELLLAGMVFFEVSRESNPVERVEGLRRITLLTMSAVGTATLLGFLARIPSFVQHRPGIFSSTTAQASSASARAQFCKLMPKGSTRCASGLDVGVALLLQPGQAHHARRREVRLLDELVPLQTAVLQRDLAHLEYHATCLQCRHPGRKLAVVRGDALAGPLHPDPTVLSFLQGQIEVLHGAALLPHPRLE